MRMLRSASFLISQIRCMSLQNITASKLIYHEYGDPVKVIEKIEARIPQPEPKQLLLRMLAAPINPADINTIQGKYPAKPVLPAVPGNEGVGEVVEVGSQVSSFAVGDRVVPLTNMLGTWQSHIVIEQSQAYKIPNELGIVEACTLTVNPCTAYRMLKDFATLEKGDVIIQNGANSACGQNVIQLSNIWGLRSVNIIRDRPNVEELKDYLKKLGATEVLTEEELRTTKLFKEKQLPKPKLALNCVGGKSATELMRTLEHSATLVTYGGMSREPVVVGTAMLIFKNVQLRGFWVTDWSQKNANSPERKEMFEDIIKYMIDKRLHGPACKLVDFNNYKEALMNTLTVQGMIGHKYILNFTNSPKC